VGRQISRRSSSRIVACADADTDASACFSALVSVRAPA
jgi:hypothetical protein